jgi:hypothetical protein
MISDYNLEDRIEPIMRLNSSTFEQYVNTLNEIKTKKTTLL